MRAVIFDFFGVILIHAQRLFLETHIPNFHERQEEFDELARQHNLGIITPKEYLLRVAEETGLPPDECMARMKSERVLNEPLIDYIRELKQRYKIGMLSNAGAELLSYLDPKLSEELFDEIIISADVGLIKPDPKIFKLACDRLDVKPAEAIMIDDLAENCEGARVAGLQAVRYRSVIRTRHAVDALLEA